MISCSTRGLRMLKRVAAAGEVHVVAAVFGRQPVIGGVVDAAERERRAQLVSFGRVVVDHVENHLDAGRVQVADHRLELAHRVERRGRRGVAVLGGEEAQRVVAPVVHQPAVDQVPVVDVLVDRQQLDGRDAQALQVVESPASEPRPA